MRACIGKINTLIYFYLELYYCQASFYNNHYYLSTKWEPDPTSARIGSFKNWCINGKLQLKVRNPIAAYSMWDLSIGHHRRPRHWIRDIMLLGAKPPPGTQRQYNHKVSYFYLNYFLHWAFTAIFEAFSYIVLWRTKIVTQSQTTSCHAFNVWAACDVMDSLYTDDLF